MAAPLRRTMTDAERTELLRWHVRADARRDVDWNEAIFHGISGVVDRYAVETRLYNPEYELAFGYLRGELAALSDPLVWAINAVLTGDALPTGIQPLGGMHELPHSGPAFEGATVNALSDAMWTRLQEHWQEVPNALEHLVLLYLVNIREHYFYGQYNHVNTAPTGDEDDDRATRGVTWELSLFTTPMLKQVSDAINRLIDLDEDELTDDGEAIVVELWIPSFEMHPEGEDVDESADVPVLVSPVRWVRDEIRREINVREAVRDRHTFVMSGAPDVVRHRLGGPRGDDRQGLDLFNVLGPYVSAAISRAVPIPTAPISHAQRLVEIQLQAARAAAEAEANPAVAARNLRRISEAIKALSESVESNKRQRRQ